MYFFIAPSVYSVSDMIIWRRLHNPIEAQILDEVRGTAMQIIIMDECRKNINLIMKKLRWAIMKYINIRISYLANNGVWNRIRNPIEAQILEDLR